MKISDLISILNHHITVHGDGHIFVGFKDCKFQYEATELSRVNSSGIVIESNKILYPEDVHTMIERNLQIELESEESNNGKLV